VRRAVKKEKAVNLLPFNWSLFFLKDGLYSTEVV